MTRPRTGIVGALAAAILGSFAWFAHAQPKEIQIDSTTCWGGTSTLLTAAEGMTLGGYQLTGTLRGTVPGNPMDGGTLECVGSFEIIGKDLRQHDVCVLVDREGHRTWGRGLVADGKSTFEYVGGTGKYVGVTGKTNRKRIPTAAAIRAGTIQGCAENVGTMQLK